MRKGKREKREKNNKKEGEKIKIKKWLVKRNKQVKFLELKYKSNKDKNSTEN